MTSQIRRKCRIYLESISVTPTNLHNYMYQVSSPYKVFNLLAVANMSEKTSQDLWGEGTPPFWGAIETTLSEN